MNIRKFELLRACKLTDVHAAPTLNKSLANHHHLFILLFFLHSSALPRLVMSGKAPPRAPRALLNSLVAGSSASVAQPPNAPSSSRLGAAPPTGPRSLSSRHVPAHIPPKGSPPKPYVNGHGSPPAGSAGAPAPPTGPSARFSHKGKSVDNNWPNQPGSTSSGAGSSSGVMVVY